MSNQDNTLCTCGCCEEGKDITPLNLVNIPGLPALHYRVGTHNSFKASMLQALSANPNLAKLTSRYDNDMAIAGIDAWATVLDVLSFYQERIINEGFLRTATERLSVIELARHISYKPGTGVAAETFLAFSMNEAPGSPAKALIPVGTKVQSVPEEDQLPQVFETTEQIEARIEWNNIKVQTTEKIIHTTNLTKIFIKGIVSNLQPGDGILIIRTKRLIDGSLFTNREFRRLLNVVPNNNADHTKLTWETGLSHIANSIDDIQHANADIKVFAFRQKAFLFGHNAPDFRTLSGNIKAEFLPSGLLGEYFNDSSFTNKVTERISADINFDWGTDSPIPGIINPNTFSIRWSGVILPPVTGLFTFYTSSDDGVQLFINNEAIITNLTTHGVTENFGTVWLQAGQLYNIRLDYFENTGAAVIKLSWSAPDLPKAIIRPKYLFNLADHLDWPDFTITGISGSTDTIHLDGIYSRIVKNSWLVMKNHSSENIYRVTDAIESSRKNFTLASKTTKITVDGPDFGDFNDHVRNTIVFAQSEELEMAEKPVDNFIQNNKEITLQQLMAGLPKEKKIILSGKRKRLEITTAGNGRLFTVAGNNIATRQLAAGDSLIILKKPERSLSGWTYIWNWTLKDDAGFEGTFSGPENTYNITGSEKEDEMVNEVHTIDTLPDGSDPTVIVLKDNVSNMFDPPTVLIYANVATGTHGETRNETLGSGNGSQAFQKFELKQKPLTFIAADSSTGTKTTLQIRVNDILWKEVDSLYNVSSKEKVYTTSFNDAGTVTVMFGDGTTGSRLPTGVENIKATYRVGIGSEGLLNAGQLSMLMSPRLGVNKVVNPLATSGAADPESRDKTRQNAPLTVLTLDRIVSAKDFEDFTRAFAGIGKAKADILWKGDRQVVYITVAGANKGPVDKNSGLYKNLLNAIKKSGHSNNLVLVENYEALFFTVNAKVLVDSNYDFEKVKKNILQALKETFSFENREFGQDVTPSEVIAVIQSLEGVVFTDLDQLNGLDIFSPHFRINAAVARRSGDAILPAQLLTINESQINITQIIS